MKRRQRGRKADPGPGDAETEIMTLQEVAYYLKVHYMTVYRLIKTASLPAFRLGSDFRFRRADVNEWVVQRHVPPPVEPKPKPSRRGRYKRKS